MVGRDAVFEHAKFATGTNDASQFAKGIDGLRDGAQREGDHAGVAAVVILSLIHIYELRARVKD